jgi:predicted MPP superfamily phosphohydrolase
MNKKTDAQDYTALEEMLKEVLKEEQSESFFNAWADTFRIQKIEKNQVVIAYFGEEPLRKFKKECGEILGFNLCLEFGHRKKIKFVQQKKKKARAKNRPSKTDSFEKELIPNPRVKKNIKAAKFFIIGLIFAFLALSFGVVLCNYIENRGFTETFYNASSLKVDNPIRVIQISDLHNCSFGKGNQKLIERVKKLKPDVILCTGDMVESSDSNLDSVIALGKGLSGVAPLYFIYGNNEVKTVYDVPLNQKELDEKFGFTDENRDETALLNLPDPLEETLSDAGFTVLKNKKDTITVGTTKIDVFGVLTSNPSSFWTYSAASYANFIYEEPENFKLLALHEPFIFEEFEPEFWGDLMVCGHTHGGMVRIPVLGPLYTKEGGLLPERSDYYVYGRYDVAGMPLIVSSGLDNSSLLRLNNEPELVIIDINKF